MGCKIRFVRAQPDALTDSGSHAVADSWPYAIADREPDETAAVRRATSAGGTAAVASTRGAQPAPDDCARAGDAATRSGSARAKRIVGFSRVNRRGRRRASPKRHGPVGRATFPEKMWEISYDFLNGSAVNRNLLKTY